ncbi:hypothetical protein DIQ79_24320 [Mycolicibacterium smegmatis]|uniref:Uncharacterized protein n=1 Tax=Mycolicibacterium smegmatis (strain ATCC 700084 / mc(2)155) TaxID=246196 RepID=A0R0T2_MYCS2|nr:hypothetical protein MSMEG_4498 [Mycolicibacterium smegmatis MC2 155]TBM39641.1 hypothetical protein DIQ86_27735 [Mycolicibacterium smegmatis]TBH33189.1 hypothetical protein EYS45_23030 [Mycolicibacterium smegmatis MC2 155]TBM48526.1 hypothetical protein DIQ85_24330 [Mycolicibacterium smegmatis]TBM58210.1 hypothetical protein DIQ83_23735 [Mycolicibacterium smegmatis]
MFRACFLCSVDGRGDRAADLSLPLVKESAQ